MYDAPTVNSFDLVVAPVLGVPFTPSGIGVVILFELEDIGIV
jgi:hypothetical protein